MRRNGIVLVMWGGSVAITLVLFACALWYGDVNQDEGWYLYAGRMVAEGKLPFIHFASTQGPFMSVAYAAAWPLVQRWGVAGGRLFTGGLGLGCILASVVLAARMARATHPGRGNRADADRGGGETTGLAALFSLMFLGINVYQATFFTLVKTYSLCGLFLVLGFLALSGATGRRSVGAAALSGVFLTLAASVRLSAAVAVPVVFLVLLLSRGTPRKSAALSFAAAVGVTGSLVVLPFLLAAPKAFWFGLVEYHTARAVEGTFIRLAYKAGFVARLVRAYFVALGVLMVLLVGAAGRCGRTGRTDGAPSRAMDWLHRAPFTLALWASVIGISLLHGLAAFPYDDYQVMVFPLFAVGLSVWLAGLAVRGPGLVPGVRTRVPRCLMLMLFGLNLAAAGSSPIVQNWFIGERDRMWWPLKTRTPLERLREAGRLVRSLAGPDELLLTQDTYLAVEAGLRVPPGMELGPFSYYPDWDDGKAESCHVLNAAGLREVIRSTPAEVAAFSAFSLSIASPSVTALSDEAHAALWNEVMARYRPHAEIEPFGQGGTRLRVLVSR